MWLVWNYCTCSSDLWFGKQFEMDHFSPGFLEPVRIVCRFIFSWGVQTEFLFLSGYIYF